jgi:hypothetical protein
MPDRRSIPLRFTEPVAVSAHSGDDRLTGAIPRPICGFDAEWFREMRPERAPAVRLSDMEARHLTALVSALALLRYATRNYPAGIKTGTTSPCRSGGELRTTNCPIVISTRMTSARAVAAKAAPRSAPQPGSFTTATGAGREHQRGRASEPPGIAGSRHSGTAGRATRQGCSASRFHVRCPPWGAIPSLS